MTSLCLNIVKQLDYKYLVALLYCFSVVVHSVELDHAHNRNSQFNEIKTAFELPLLKVISNAINSNAKSKPSASSGKVKLKDYAGKVVYIDFWASWCTPCMVSMPMLNNLRNKYHQAGFEVIAINLDNNPLLASEFISAMNIDYPIVFDEGGIIANQYNVTGLPSAYIIDANGKIKVVHRGFKKSDVSFLEAVINKYLDEIDPISEETST